MRRVLAGRCFLEGTFFSRLSWEEVVRNTILYDIIHMLVCSTLPETNIAPQNRPSQKEISIPTIHFQVRTLSFREGMCIV